MTQIANRESAPFVWMDSKDDEAIALELKGIKSTALVYEFPQGETTVRGLSKVGVDEATRELAVGRGEVIRVLGDPIWKQNGDYYEVTVKAGRFAVSADGREIGLDTTIGAKRQWLKMTLRTGEVVPDPFAFEKALSKAVRNAKHALLPIDIVESMIAKGKAEGRVASASPDSSTSSPGGEVYSETNPPKSWPCTYKGCHATLQLKEGKHGKFYSHKAGTDWHNAHVKDILDLAQKAHRPTQDAQEGPPEARQSPSEAPPVVDEAPATEHVGFEARLARFFDWAKVKYGLEPGKALAAAGIAMNQVTEKTDLHWVAGEIEKLYGTPKRGDNALTT